MPGFCPKVCSTILLFSVLLVLTHCANDTSKRKHFPSRLKNQNRTSVSCQPDVGSLVDPEAAVVPEFKLIYFDIPWRGEGPKLLFHYAGVPFDDMQIKLKDWPELKSSLFSGSTLSS